MLRYFYCLNIVNYIQWTKSKTIQLIQTLNTLSFVFGRVIYIAGFDSP